MTEAFSKNGKVFSDLMLLSESLFCLCQWLQKCCKNSSTVS